MMLFVQLVVAAAVGTACALIANSRGRSPVGWFFIGAFVPCFVGLILVLVLPDLKVQEERERRLADENRRLRERLRKDRMVADERHGEIARRLVAHDVALGVDTAGAVAALPPGTTRAPTPDADEPPDPAAAELRASSWFWAQGTNRQGPVDFGAMQSLWREGRLTMETLVWRKGMAQWAPVRDVPLLPEALDV